MAKLSLTDVSLEGKVVLMRVDFNVPIKNGKITDDTRIVEALPSITYILKAKAKLILTSHFGRPKAEPDAEFSLRPVAGYLSKLIPHKVNFAKDCVGEVAQKAIENTGFGEVVVLENVRFHPGETANDKTFAKALSSNADVFVNDAFGSSHRAHASVAGVTEFIQPSVAGFLLQKEIKYLNESVNSPIRPFVAILGGAKVSDKIGVIENLLDKVDSIIIGGGMTYTFYKAMGLPIGNSLLEDDKVELAASLMEKAKKKGVSFLLPVDSVVADAFSNEANSKTVGENGIEDGWMALDIGPKSIDLFSGIIRKAKTIVWNGPMGVFEMSNFSKGTFAVADALVYATENGAITIVGGGDSAAAINEAGLAGKVSHVSTGGGASLEYLEGKDLPGVSSLTEA